MTYNTDQCNISLYDALQGIDRISGGDQPILDMYNAIHDESDIARACQLLRLATHKHSKVTRGLIVPSTLVLCRYENEIYLIDENTNLWDIYETDEETHLSVLSVGYLGYGIDGFVIDLKDEHPELMDEWWRNFLDGEAA